VAQPHRLLAHYAAHNRLAITKWFQETSHSSFHARPEFHRMLRDLKAGKASGVITESHERFTRKLTEWVDFLSLGVQLHCAMDSGKAKSHLRTSKNAKGHRGRPQSMVVKLA
jgi:DNA invertase Pin-like site-specific DNA recombinase